MSQMRKKAAFSLGMKELMFLAILAVIFYILWKIISGYMDGLR